MISAADAKKVTLEAKEAIQKKQTLEQSRRLEKLFQGRMKDSDNYVKAAMKQGDEKASFVWDNEEFPEELRHRYEAHMQSLGYTCVIHSNDDNDGFEICLLWGNA